MKSDKYTESDDDTVVEDFPKCLFLIYDKVSLTSRLVVNGIRASGEESSEFNLASPTLSNYKFKVHDHYSKDPCIVKISKLQIYITNSLSFILEL